MKIHGVVKILAYLILVFVLMGCSSGAATPAINPTEGVLLLNGVYITTITAEDIASDQALDPNLPEMVGNWVVKFYDDGKFDAEVDGQWMGAGIYTVKGSEIAIYISNVCDNCPCDESIGRYNWLFKDNKLYMAKKAGTCDLMHTLFTTHPMLRQP